ncbi:MAG: YigZ family protein [Acidobacteriota bacterium]|nr:MAG: YigZ family protein [Acidobacteriota bacterium]
MTDGENGLPADPDCFVSLEDGDEVEIKVKGSRFIGQALHADSEASALERLAAVRRRYHDATHHCWAMRIGSPGRLRERYDDAGEPAGTAGPPILRAIEREAIHDAVVVVTRYYGGTKLGTGGLARAYADAARDAIAAARRRELFRCVTLALECSFDDLGAIEAVLARSGVFVRDVQRTFSPSPCFMLSVLASRAAALTATIRDVTAGRAAVTRRPASD